MILRGLASSWFVTSTLTSFCFPFPSSFTTSYQRLQRCWHDSEGLVIPEQLLQDPLLRPLKPGEIGVSFFPSQDREITSDSKFKLVDRPFQTGDVCKRRVEDVQSGVVKSVNTNFKAAHVISKEVVKDWLTKEDIDDVDETCDWKYSSL